MSHPNALASFSAPAAATYQGFFVPLIPAQLAADLVERAAPSPGQRVADIGCGTGVVARLAAARVGVAGAVVGLDPSPDMLDVARDLPAPGGAPIEWRQAGAEDLPLADGACDVVCCQLALMIVPDQAAAVAEIGRVLAPGGRVALNVPGRPVPEPFTVMGEALGRHVDPGLAGFVASVFSLGDPAVVARLLADGGLIDVEAEATVRSFRLGPPEEFLWGYIASTPLAGAVAAAGEEALAAVRDDVLAGWAPFVHDGSLIIDQSIVVATARTPASGATTSG